MRLGTQLGLGLGLLALSGCTWSWFDQTPAYDAKPLTVETVSLFNQRTANRLNAKSWKGDWIFRRDRLAMIDQDLRNTKPDLLLLQEAVQRIGNNAESDQSILQAGALADYDWHQQTVQEYPDTQETEQVAVAADGLLKFTAGSDGKKETWALGGGGYVMLATLDYEDQTVLVASVQMPSSGVSSLIWYGFLRERLVAKLTSAKLCAKRLIVAGLLPGDEATEAFGDFIRTLQLKDSAEGFCQLAGRCFTATPGNDLFMATIGENTPTRTDKIFVHRSANVSSSSRAFDDHVSDNAYAHEFGLERLWPTQRFGWRSQLRLGRCTPGELGFGSL